MALGNQPRVSVICPTFNRSEAILATVNSVREQSVPDWELIVVSDGSTDDTEEWVRSAAARDARIRLIRTERHGHPSEPRNAGLALARGDVVAYLDHDDRWRDDHLAVLLSAFDDGAELVATGFERRDKAESVRAVSDPIGLCWHPEIQVLSPLFEPSRTAHLRGLPEKVGGWRAGVGLEDWDLWLRLTDAGIGFTTLPERTTILLDDRGTRRYRTMRRSRMPLAAFDDARRAHQVLQELKHERHQTAFFDAFVTDTKAWFRRLAGTPEFVRPRGWQGDLDAEITRRAGEDYQAWSDDVVLVPVRGRYLLALTLWCATAEHARRIEELSQQIQPTQLALIAQIATG